MRKWNFSSEMIALHNRCGLVIALLAVAGATTACSPSTTALPDPVTMPTRASVPADRARHQQSMNDLQSRGATHAADAVKEIETRR